MNEEERLALEHHLVSMLTLIVALPRSEFNHGQRVAYRNVLNILKRRPENDHIKEEGIYDEARG